MRKTSNPELRKMKLMLNRDYREKSLVKISYFTKSTDSLPDMSGDFKNAILTSIDLKWQNTHRDPTSPTEIGVATIRGNDVTNAIQAIDTGGSPAQILV
jgi:hypothetical protein